jgi:hypothetical protein
MRWISSSALSRRSLRRWLYVWSELCEAVCTRVIRESNCLLIVCSFLFLFCVLFCFFFLIFASFCSDPVIGSIPVGFRTCSTAKHRPSPFAGQWYPALLVVIVRPWSIIIIVRPWWEQTPCRSRNARQNVSWERKQNGCWRSRIWEQTHICKTSLCKRNQCT